MAYTTINKSTDYFNTLTYTGDDGTNRSITGVGFQPDFIWFKDRSNSFNHYLFDIIRDGQTYYISSNNNAGEAADTTSLKSMDSDGFTVGASAGVNGNNNNYASWNWKANGTGVANTAGSINSTVSVNTTSGFSIVKYTGTGSAATVGHGLGVKPDMIFSKPYSTAGDWNVYNDSFAAQQRIKLNSTAGVSTNTQIFSSLPTSTLVSIGTSGDINASGTSHLFYCFNSVQGYSKFGSYTGNNNADGTFVYLGFKPAFVMIKRSSDVQGWVMWDSKRPGYNLTNQSLTANESSAEETGRTFDMLSNGFKLRDTNTATNAASTYIYMAFAAAPLVGTNNIPANAR
mgnify:CR=1 FL=1